MDKTLKQQGEETREKILKSIVSYIEEHGYSPSVRDICDMTGLKSTSTIKSHLDRMFRDGLLETDCGIGTPRAIRVPGYKFLKIGSDEN